MPYIHFTEEQKLLAASVDLPEYLRCQGEKLIRSGPEYRLSSDHSVTVRGNEWYDHAAEQGGGPVSFLQTFYHLSYPEAVSRLLGNGQLCQEDQSQKKKSQKAFALPNINKDMRRLYAYLLKKRHISREVLNEFVRAGLIYESCEKSADGQREYHNAVFVGKDEHGAARHAHKRSVSDMSKTFRINVEGSDTRCSFHWCGSSDRLYVFEAPIDLMSYLTLYPEDWQTHSYVALCGTAEHAMLWMLEQNPAIRSVILCLDHDEAGIEASGRLAEALREQGVQASVLRPEQKDWNEDIKAGLGLEAQSAEEHPQLTAAPEVCGQIGVISEGVRLERLEQELTAQIKQYQSELYWGRVSKAMECMERASALALAAYARELRQLGQPCSTEEMTAALQCRIQPHQNRGNLENRHRALSAELRKVLAKANAPGVRSQAEKWELADMWLGLAVEFAKIPVKLTADEMKEQTRQEQKYEMRME